MVEAAGCDLMNLARSCATVNCPVQTALSCCATPGEAYKINDGVSTTFIQTPLEMKPYAILDLQQVRIVTSVKITNNFNPNRLSSFEIRVGLSSTFIDNPMCTLSTFVFSGIKDFNCQNPLPGCNNGVYLDSSVGNLARTCNTNCPVTSGSVITTAANINDGRAADNEAIRGFPQRPQQLAQKELSAKSDFDELGHAPPIHPQPPPTAHSFRARPDHRVCKMV